MGVMMKVDVRTLHILVLLREEENRATSLHSLCLRNMSDVKHYNDANYQVMTLYSGGNSHRWGLFFLCSSFLCKVAGGLDS